MRRISTGLEQLLTSDAIADAVVDYATALARSETADTVTIPMVRADGVVDEARLLLGPASQITLVPDISADIEFPTADAVLQDLRRRLHPSESDFTSEDDIKDAEPGAVFPDFDEFVQGGLK